MNQLNIAPRLCLTKQHEVTALVDESNGIVCAIAMPSISEEVRSVLTWQHPLSLWHNVKGLLQQPTSWFEKLDQNILAGLFITTYNHYSLLEPYQLSGAELNAILQTASKESIIALLQLAAHFTSKNTLGVGCLVLDWQDVSQRANLTSTLVAYYKRIRPYFIRLDNSEVQDNTAQRIKRLDMLAREGRQLAGGTYLSGKQTLSSMEKEFDAKLKANKKELKTLLLVAKDSKDASGAPHLTAKQLSTLQTIGTGRNLVTLNDELKAKIKAKLSALSLEWATQIVKIIDDSHNPYDRALVEQGLERASESFSPAMQFKTIAELLAYKRSLRSEEAAQPAEGDRRPQGTALSEALDTSLDHIGDYIEDHIGDDDLAGEDDDYIDGL